MEDVKEKLITLFKQCCENHNLAKTNDMTKVGESYKSTHEIPYMVSNELMQLLNDLGFNDITNGNRFNLSNVCREFKFESEPPIRLFFATHSMNCVLMGKYSELSDILTRQSENKYSVSVEKTNIWGKTKLKDIKKHIDIKYRTLKINEDVCTKINELGNTENRLGEIDLVSYWDIRPDTILFEDNDGLRWSKNESWMERSHNGEIRPRRSCSIDELNTPDTLIKRYTNLNIRVKCGIITFGDLWVWVDYNTYNLLNTLYNDAITRSTISLLDQRINETKK